MDWHGHAILAPLTKGGNLPFRRLCVDFGAQVTMSEMAYARQVKRGSRSELALLRKHGSETCFGVQLAAGKPEEAVAAGQKAIAAGAAFVDINAGCPIHDVVRRGMGATLLQRPAALHKVLAALVEALEVPVTVKLRTGWKESKINCSEVARLAEEAGVAAITLHGRTKEQRYSKAADWDLVRQLVEERSVPVIGNGDILTHYEAKARQEASGCASVMLARGALIKPWLFQEIAEGRAFEPDAEARVGIYRRFVGYLKEHFYDDEKGRGRAMRFLPWHLNFFWRYRPLPEAQFATQAAEHPLLQTRISDEGPVDELEALLRDPRPEVHQQMADLLWDVGEEAECLARLRELGAGLPALEEEAAGGEIRTSCG